MVLTTTEEYQEIKIVTRYNFIDMAQITGVSSGTHHTLTLVLNSVPETRKLHFFILGLCRWVNENSCVFSQEVAELDEEHRLLFDSILFTHAVPSACQTVVSKRQLRLVNALCTEVTQQLLPEDEEAKEATQQLLPEDEEAKEVTQQLLPEDEEAKEVTQQLLPEDEEAKEAKDALTGAFEGRVPRVLLGLVRRLTSLKAYDQMGTFREGGKVGQRDAFLEQIDGVDI